MVSARAFLGLLSAISTTLAAPVERQNPTGFAWADNNAKIRGVNLGGWLVLEPWITPSIFRKFPNSQGIVDEFTLCSSLGASKAYSDILKPHWDSWVTLSDLQKIKSYGFNMVRIPIGYWAYDNRNSPYASGAAPYLDKAIGWARQTGLKVMIDLHGVRGSQNGFDNSGHRVSKPGWQTNGYFVENALEVLNTIQSKYGNSQYDDVIAGIELLNEPLTPQLNLDNVKQWEKDGYNQQRKYSGSRVVVVQDGFQTVSSYNGWLTPSDNNAQNVAMDHHEYQVFDNYLVGMQPWQHRQFVCNNVGQYNNADKWTFVGEWSAAMTDCATYLNGYLIGSRYDGSYPGSSYHGSCADKNDISKWSSSFRDDMRGYIEAQLDTYERQTRGWIFWNFKTEGSPEWDVFRLVQNGIFPQPLTARKFSPVCSN